MEISDNLQPSAALNLGKGPHCSLDRRLVELQTSYEHWRRENISFPLQELKINSSVVQFVT
jgi:hypothetical protein